MPGLKTSSPPQGQGPRPANNAIASKPRPPTSGRHVLFDDIAATSRTRAPTLTRRCHLESSALNLKVSCSPQRRHYCLRDAVAAASALKSVSPTSRCCTHLEDDAVTSGTTTPTSRTNATSRLTMPRQAPLPQPQDSGTDLEMALCLKDQAAASSTAAATQG
jgi:hypothetical protein